TNENGTVGLGGDLDGHTTVWDLTRGERLTRLPCTAGIVTAVAITPDARIGATATTPGAVTVWDLATSEPVARLPGRMNANALALSPNADCLLVAGGGLAVYALTEGAPPRLVARLVTAHQVTAVAVNLAMPMYAPFGGAYGQVGYVRLP